MLADSVPKSLFLGSFQPSVVTKNKDLRSLARFILLLFQQPLCTKFSPRALLILTPIMHIQGVYGSAARSVGSRASRGDPPRTRRGGTGGLGN